MFSTDLFINLTAYFGHVTRRNRNANNIEKLLISGKVEGKRPRGTSSKRWSDRVRRAGDTSECHYPLAIHQAVDRVVDINELLMLSLHEVAIPNYGGTIEEDEDLFLGVRVLGNSSKYARANSVNVCRQGSKTLEKLLQSFLKILTSTEPTVLYSLVPILKLIWSIVKPVHCFINKILS